MGERIRVLHLIEHLRVGGAERVVVDLVHHLDADCFESVVCLYRDRGVLSEEVENDGCPVIFMSKDPLTRSVRGLLRVLLAPVVLLESAVFLVRLRMLLWKYRIDVVHAHEFSANLWGRIAAKILGRHRIVTTEHLERAGDRSAKRVVLNRLLAGLSDRIVAVSNSVARTVSAQTGVPLERIEVIANGIRMPSGRGCESSLESTLPGRRPRVAAIGRVVRQKRFDLLVEAMAICVKSVPSLSCLIVGDGGERREIQERIEERGLQGNIFMLGERRDVRRILECVDVVVNSSDTEGLPISLLEAMAAGKPIVATRAGGNEEIVEDGRTGFLVDTGDFMALAERTLRLLAAAEKAQEMGEAASRKVRSSHSAEVMTARWEELYRRVLGRQEEGPHECGG